MSKGRAAQLVEAGLWLRLSGDHEGARRLFEQALKLDPENQRAKQLLDAPPSGAAAPGEGLKPPASSPAMDLDWGSATGFDAPEVKPPPVAPAAEPPKGPLPPPVFELPVEGDITMGPEPITNSYGVPPELPTAPEPWADHVPAVASPRSPPRPVPPTVSPFAPPADAPTSGNTLVFSGQPGAAQPPPGAPEHTTMVFGGGAPPPVAPASSGTMVFGGQPGAPAPGPGAPPMSSGTLVMMQPGAAAVPPLAPASGTLVFTQPVAPPLGVNAPPAVPVADRAAELFGSFEPEPELPPPDAPPPPLPQPPGASPAALMKGAKSGWDRQSNPGIELKDAAPELANALDLVKDPHPRSTVPPGAASPDQRKQEAAALLRGAKDLLELDDHTGAMELIVKAQEIAPDDPDVKAMRARSERTLEAMFESKLGDLNSMPRVKLKDDEIIWLNLDHRAGFVLAQIDGTVSFEDIFAVSGMSRLDTARILAQLLEEGVISRA